MNRAAAPLSEVLDVSDEHLAAIKRCCADAFEAQPTGAHARTPAPAIPTHRVPSAASPRPPACPPVLWHPPAGASVLGALARRIRGELERATGLVGWSVVIGRSFGAGVTHRHQHYAHLQPVPGMSVLVWRS